MLGGPDSLLDGFLLLHIKTELIMPEHFHDLGHIHKQLIVRKDSREVRRFWQQGGGYDRNIYNQEILRQTIEYVNYNPVSKGLAVKPEYWKWSSARYYITGEAEPLNIDEVEWL